MSGAPALRTEGLAVGHDGRALVERIDLSVAPGALVAVLGGNGSGKSTLLRTVAGLLAPVAGRVEVLGGPPGAAPERAAYLAQSAPSEFTLPLRAADVVTMGRYARRGLLGRLTRSDRTAVRRAMERMGVAGLAGAAVATLSGGQRRRIDIAQALAREADLLVLDEPTAGLDLPGQELLWSALSEERARGAAVLVSTHDVSDALPADTALLLARRVVAAGPPARTLTRETLGETFGPLLGLPDGVTVAIDPEHRHGAHDEAPGPRRRV